MSQEKPTGYDAEMDAIMKQKFAKLQETQQDPQARANLLVQKYVDVLDRLLGGTKTYDADYQFFIFWS